MSGRNSVIPFLSDTWGLPLYLVCNAFRFKSPSHCHGISWSDSCAHWWTSHRRTIEGRHWWRREKRANAWCNSCFHHFYSKFIRLRVILWDQWGNGAVVDVRDVVDAKTHYGRKIGDACVIGKSEWVTSQLKCVAQSGDMAGAVRTVRLKRNSTSAVCGVRCSRIYCIQVRELLLSGILSFFHVIILFFSNYGRATVGLGPTDLSRRFYGDLFLKNWLP